MFFVSIKYNMRLVGEMPHFYSLIVERKLINVLLTFPCHINESGRGFFILVTNLRYSPVCRDTAFLLPLNEL